MCSFFLRFSDQAKPTTNIRELYGGDDGKCIIVFQTYRKVDDTYDVPISSSLTLTLNRNPNPYRTVEDTYDVPISSLFSKDELIDIILFYLCRHRPRLLTQYGVLVSLMPDSPVIHWAHMDNYYFETNTIHNTRANTKMHIRSYESPEFVRSLDFDGLVKLYDVLIRNEMVELTKFVHDGGGAPVFTVVGYP
mgnify:CR=1 FL=1